MTPFIRSMFVVARRDFLAIVATPTFLLFLLAPLFMVGMGLAGGMGASQLAEEDAFERDRSGEDFDDLVALFFGERTHRLASEQQGQKEDEEYRTKAERLLHRDAGAAAPNAFEARFHRGDIARRAIAQRLVREQRQIAAGAALGITFDDARVCERAGHHGIGVGALFARDSVRVGRGLACHAKFERRRGFAARKGLAEAAVGGAQRFDIGGIGDRDDAAGAAGAVGELRGAHAAGKPHRDHEQRRKQEKQKGGGRDDRQKVAPRDDEHAADERGHALASMPATGWPFFLGIGFAYFILSFLLLGAVFLGVGAQAGSVREIQMLSLPITIFQVGMFSLSAAAASAPGSGLAHFAQIFPFSSPLAMAARAATDDARAVHLLALGWQAIWVALVIFLSVRLFRAGVLSGGSGWKFWRRAKKG